MQCEYALQYVKEQTEEICKLAVDQNKNVIEYIKDISLRDNITLIYKK